MQMFSKSLGFTIGLARTVKVNPLIIIGIYLYMCNMPMGFTRFGTALDFVG